MFAASQQLPAPVENPKNRRPPPSLPKILALRIGALVLPAAPRNSYGKSGTTVKRSGVLQRELCPCVVFLQQSRGSGLGTRLNSWWPSRRNTLFPDDPAFDLG